MVQFNFPKKKKFYVNIVNLRESDQAACFYLHFIRLFSFYISDKLGLPSDIIYSSRYCSLLL